MTQTVINPRIRGFICTAAHPAGCAANVRKQVELALKDGPGRGIGNALVVGSSAGFGLSSLLTLAFAHGAKCLGVAFERPAQGDRTASAGWYNLVEAHRLAKIHGRSIDTINGDAYTTAIKEQVIAALKASGVKLDYLVYSLASPKRTDPVTGITHASTLKPIGPSFTAKTVNLDDSSVGPITIAPATDADVANTVKVMGGEDWQLWIDALRAADLLAPGFRTVAYSYIGPQLTHAIYRAGTIGAAKDHLEATAKTLSNSLAAIGGHAWVSVNKALVSQASSAIPVVPLYIGLLYKAMKAKGTHEGTIEQILRLFRDHIGPGKQPALDANGRIRIDDFEMAADIQASVQAAWDKVDTANLAAISDFAGFRSEFRGLFGFELPGIDYTAPVEVDLALNA